MKEYTLHSSDPFGRDLVLVDEDGNKVDGIVSLNVFADYGEPIRVNVELIPAGVNMNVHLDQVKLVCPVCRYETDDHECRPKKAEPT